MKEIIKKKISKQIICIIMVIMLCNFILPNYIYAADTNDGGDLLADIAKFICFVPDVVVEFLQDMFISSQKIKISDEEYKIKYAPGTIFSGEIPAFNTNFITPNEKSIIR